MKIISEIKIKINGEPCVAQVTEDGYAILPDNTRKKLSDEQFATIVERLNKSIIANDAARPLTMPESAKEEKVQSVAVDPPLPLNAPTDRQPPSVPEKAIILPKETVMSAPKREKAKKEKPVPKEKPEKLKQGNSIVTAIFAAGFVALTLMFMYAAMSGLISFGSGSSIDQQTPPSGNSTPIDPAPTPDIGTQEDLEKAETILIIARIVTPDGKEKEVVLGYFTTDGESSSLPDIADGTNSGDNSNSRLTLNEGFTEGAVTLANKYSPVRYLDTFNNLN